MRFSQIQVLVICLLTCLCAGLSPAQTSAPSVEPSSGAAPALLGDPASASAPAAASTAPAAPAAPLPATPPARAPSGESASRPAPPSPLPLAAPAASRPVSDIDRRAAEGLLHSAESLLYSPGDTPGRAGRILALARMADKLRPGDFDTNWLLVGVYQAAGDDQEMADALGACLASSPGDYLLGLQYLQLNLGLLPTADARLAFLRTFAKRTELPASLRADALAFAGQTLRGQGRIPDARTAFEEALKLDPAQPQAAQGRLALTKDAALPDRLRTTLAMIRGNPRNGSLAEQAGSLLEEAGLYPQSLPFYEHALKMSDMAGDRTLRQFIVPRYCNAMLDARNYREAVTTFLPLLAEVPGSDLQALLVEAYTGMGDPLHAAQMRTALRITLMDQEKASGNSGTFAIELAQYYEVTDPDPNLALRYAQTAFDKDPESPAAQRVLGVAEIRTGKNNEGIARLKPLAKTDVWAARFLAEYYLNPGNPGRDLELGRQAIRDGAAAARFGPGYRELIVLAARYGVEITPATAATEAGELADAFDRQYLAMPLTPNKFLSVTVGPVKDPVVPGEPIWVEAVMTNFSNAEIPLGDWGLVDPRLSLAASTKQMPEPFGNLPVISWRAPRYLPPGAILTARVRLDVGIFGRYIAHRPLEDLTFNLLPTMDPVRRGELFVSSLPGMTVPLASLRRQALVSVPEANDPQPLAKACAAELGHIVYDLQNGDLSARLLAARQTAGLLGLERLYETGKANLSKPLAAVLARGVLLRMMVEALKDSSDLVRAEMLAALGQVPLDGRILELLSQAGLIQDASPLVRLRMVELLGGSGLSGQQPVLDYFAKDPDEMVRLMASAFAPAKPKKR